MKEDANDGTFFGYPLRSLDASEEDCRRTDWEAKINGKWQEVNVGTLGYDFNEKHAMEAVIRCLQHDYEELKKKLEELESDRQSQQEMAASMRNEE